MDHRRNRLPAQPATCPFLGLLASSRRRNRALYSISPSPRCDYERIDFLDAEQLVSPRNSPHSTWFPRRRSLVCPETPKSAACVPRASGSAAETLGFRRAYRTPLAKLRGRAGTGCGKPVLAHACGTNSPGALAAPGNRPQPMGPCMVPCRAWCAACLARRAAYLARSAALVTSSNERLLVRSLPPRDPLAPSPGQKLTLTERKV